MKLSILDLCRTSSSLSADDSLWCTIELAQEAERLGYHRYWLAEHHAGDVAHSSPDLLTGILCGITKSLRIGTAGVLLRYHSSYRIASAFRLLNLLFPGRVDLGLARGWVDPAVDRALRGSDAGLDDFGVKVGDMVRFLRGTADIQVRPPGVASPELWLLGSQQGALEYATTHGTCFCLSLFLGTPPGRESARLISEYRRRFIPSEFESRPVWSVAVAGVCSDDGRRAQEIAASWGPGVKPSVIGTPDECSEQLHRISELHGADEIVFLDMCQRPEDRLSACRLLADGVGLRP